MCTVSYSCYITNSVVMMVPFVCMCVYYRLQPQNAVKNTMTTYTSYVHTEYIHSFWIMSGVGNVGMFIIWDDSCVCIRYAHQYDSPDEW